MAREGAFVGAVWLGHSGCPGGEQGERLGGGRVGFGRVDRHGEAGFGAEVDTFVGEGEVAHDVVVEVFDTSAVGANVVGSPSATELVGAGGELSDKVV